MTGSIILAPNTYPSGSINLATGGSVGNIYQPKSGSSTGTITVTPRTSPITTTPSTNSSSSSTLPVYNGGSYTPQIYAPALDTNAIYSKASTAAAANVNPYYTKLLNDFITQQGTTRQQQQQQTDVNIKNLQDQLAQIQEANTVTGNRTTEDTATNEAQIAQAADNRQLDQGTAFNAARNNEAVSLAESGLTGSGLAAGKQATSQNTQDVTEGRQATADQQAKDSAELTKARTFEDLATSNKNAASAESKGETQAQFDLSKFITGQSSDLQQEQQQLEAERQQHLASETQNQTKILVSNFINSIANPAQRAAAYSAYGGFL